MTHYTSAVTIDDKGKIIATSSTPVYDYVPFGTFRSAVIAANNGFTWAWSFTKALAKGPSIGPGSCLGVLADTVTAPLKQVQRAAKDYVPLIVSAMQSSPAAAGWYVQQVNNMVGAGAADAEQAAPVIAGVTTAGAAAATAVPYVSAAAPYVAPAGADAVLLNGVIKEVQAGMKGQCAW